MARRYQNLFPAITAFPNLHAAFRRAARGKRSRPEVATFEFNLEPNLFTLQAELEADCYRPGEYRSFYIRDPKHRLISAAPFRDRVLHHALCAVTEPLLELTFIGDSFACRKGKGTHAAIDRAQYFARRYPYVLQCDIRQFFPSVDHGILHDILARKFDDERTMALIGYILQGSEGVLDDEYDPVYFPGDDLLATLRPRGLPIGNLTSQFWANVYMNELDQFIKRELRVKGYLRYVDDFLLFANDKASLWEWKTAIRERLAMLRLTLHERESTVYPVRTGIPFLGFRIYPTHRRLKRANGVAFQRRLARHRRAVARGEMSVADAHNRVRGWVAHAAHGNTRGLRRALLAEPLVS